MKRTAFVVLALAFTLAGCGGKSATPATQPPGGGRIAGPGQVVGDAALYDKLKASTLALPVGSAEMQCSGEEHTLGAQIAVWQQQLGGPIAAKCEAVHCTVELTSPIDPACDTNPDQDGCDGGSTWVIEFDLDGAGEIVPASLMCMAAG